MAWLRAWGKSMEVKDWIALGALIVSLGSAWAAIDARNEAQRLSERQFETETTLDILSSVYTHIAPEDDPTRAGQACLFIITLADAEMAMRSEPPFFVREFVENTSSQGFWNAKCRQRMEPIRAAAHDQPEQPSEIKIQDGGENLELPTDRPAEIGKWHALVASYDTTPRGCAYAKEDVKTFSRDLSSEQVGKPYVYIVRTRISNNYAVTVDAGDERERAVTLTQAVRNVARSDGTGRDSFVQGNRDWYIDPECSSFARVGDAT